MLDLAVHLAYYDFGHPSGQQFSDRYEEGPPRLAAACEALLVVHVN